MPGYDRFLSSKIKALGGPKWDEFIRTLATDIAKLTESDRLDKQIADRLLGRGLQVIEDLVTPVAAQAQTRVDQIDTLINQGTSDVQAFVATGQGQVNTFVAAAQAQVDSLEGEADAAVAAVNAAAAQIAQYLADLQGQGISADLVNETATRLWLTAALKATYDGYAAAIAARAPLASPALTGAPTAPTVAGTVDATTKIATTEFVQAVVAAAKASILNGSPAALDTLAELAAAIGDDANFAATMTAALGNRVRYDAAQTLDAGQKTQARNNIGAGTSSFDGAYSSLTSKPTLGTAAALDVGTGANQVVQRDAAGKYPAGDGSAITGVGLAAATQAEMAAAAATNVAVSPGRIVHDPAHLKAGIVFYYTLTLQGTSVSSVNTTTDEITMSAAHGLSTGDIVGHVAPSSVGIGGWTQYAFYFARVTGSTTFTIHPTSADAVNNTNKIDLTSAGSNTRHIYRYNVTVIWSYRAAATNPIIPKIGVAWNAMSASVGAGQMRFTFANALSSAASGFARAGCCDANDRAFALVTSITATTYLEWSTLGGGQGLHGSAYVHHAMIYGDE